MLETFEDSEEIREPIVFATWKKVAGQSLAKQTNPISLVGKKLIVGVPDETWKQHLEPLAGQMIFKLNAVLKQSLVSFIEFSIDENAFRNLRSKEEEKAEPISIPGDLVSKELRHSADSISDNGLRKQFLLAAEGCLERKHRIAQTK